MENNLPFGGKVMIMGGDFRQVLPVVKGGSIGQQIASSVSKSAFWGGVKTVRLQTNMRSQEDHEFSQFLLRIGDGIQQSLNGDFIHLPQSMVIPGEHEQSIYQLIDSIFINMVDHADDANYMVGRAIITPRNIDVDNINQMLIELFPSEERVYTSWDSVDEDNNNNLYIAELINSLSISGLPPHQLTLKRGSPIMLLRNVAPELGLCNGTRLICQNLETNFIDAKIMTGPYQGDHFSTTPDFIHVDATHIKELEEQIEGWEKRIAWIEEWDLTKVFGKLYCEHF
ncbi:hypothetical protein BUALT_Bualt09G0002400 [Buddleja alternifolia]|uniref:ATP-dependent DNA helicase n=1 Tax=Buddleja alternifolia TaxID=168488 RepID=A0AAV6WYS2_9LAMI|nr:hypothetical protein BUALT_Bualt09G0002400 [Buddleja alternifolia]